jgi:hypothetical protein
MKKILDFGPLTGSLLKMTYWHMSSGLINALLSSFTMIFILNYLIKHIGPEIQAAKSLLEMSLMFLALLIVGHVSRQQRWLKYLYFWIIAVAVWESFAVLLLVADPTMCAFALGGIVGFFMIEQRLMSYGTNLVFRGEAKTAHENVVQLAGTLGAIVGSGLAIAFKDINIWTAIWTEVSAVCAIWAPMVIWGTKLVFNEIDRQGGVVVLAAKINKEL